MRKRMKQSLKKIGIITGVIILLAVLFYIHLNNGYKEKIVECEGLGCRLILPDGWEGKCDFEVDEDGLLAYHRKTRVLRYIDGPGRLFYLRKWEGVYTEEQVQGRAVQPTIFLGADEEGAYVLICASSVEAEWFWEEYNQLYNEIGEIRIEIYGRD